MISVDGRQWVTRVKCALRLRNRTMLEASHPRRTRVGNGDELEPLDTDIASHASKASHAILAKKRKGIRQDSRRATSRFGAKGDASDAEDAILAFRIDQ